MAEMTDRTTHSRHFWPNHCGSDRSEKNGFGPNGFGVRTASGQTAPSGHDRAQRSFVQRAKTRAMAMATCLSLALVILTANTAIAQDNEGLRQEMPAPPVRLDPNAVPDPQMSQTPPPIATPASPGPQTAAPLIPGTLQGRAIATLTETSGPLNRDVHWRIYGANPAPDGTHQTVLTSDEAQPQLTLDPGEYIAVAVYGHAVASTPLKVAVSGYTAQVNLDAGAVRLLPQRPGGVPLDDKDVKLSIYEAKLDDFGQRRLIIDDAPSQSLVALNSGEYHVVSQFGDANSTIRGDVKVEPGKLNEVGITHSASSVTLKLVNTPGGEALANTAWSILSPGGDIVKESFGAFPSHILASGTYSVIARHDGQIFNREFSIEGGQAYEVEVVAQ
jgi:hypothetical protein